MAARFSAGQYEDAFTPPRLQNWSVARRCRQRPSPRHGFTQPLANDRGHLLPSVPRSQTPPWGTFLGTWEMPARIPPPKLNLTARSAAAAAQLCGWIQNSTALSRACNGVSTHIIGKPQEICGAPCATLEPTSSNEDTHGVQPSPTAAAEEQRGSNTMGQNSAPGGHRGAEMGPKPTLKAIQPPPPPSPSAGAEQSLQSAAKPELR